MDWKELGWNLAGAIAQMATPIGGLVVDSIREVVKKSGDGISNESVITVLKEMGKSKWNNVGDPLVDIVEVAIAQEEITMEQRDEIIAILVRKEVSAKDEVRVAVKKVLKSQDEKFEIEDFKEISTQMLQSKGVELVKDKALDLFKNL